METMIVTTFAGYAASSAPRLVAPTLDRLQGTGVPGVAGNDWRLARRRITSAEHDSVPRAPLV